MFDTILFDNTWMMVPSLLPGFLLMTWLPTSSLNPFSLLFSYAIALILGLLLLNYFIFHFIFSSLSLSILFFLLFIYLFSFSLLSSTSVLVGVCWTVFLLQGQCRYTRHMIVRYIYSFSLVSRLFPQLSPSSLTLRYVSLILLAMLYTWRCM